MVPAVCDHTLGECQHSPHWPGFFLWGEGVVLGLELRTLHLPIDFAGVV
jgi:hypothetical protein